MEDYHLYLEVTCGIISVISRIFKVIGGILKFIVCIWKLLGNDKAYFSKIIIMCIFYFMYLFN